MPEKGGPRLWTPWRLSSPGSPRTDIIQLAQGRRKTEQARGEQGRVAVRYVGGISPEPRMTRRVDVLTLDDPAPGPRDVVVQVAACGICGTDLHILAGEFAPSLPIVFISDRLPLAGYAEALTLFERGEGRQIQVLP